MASSSQWAWGFQLRGFLEDSSPVWHILGPRPSASQRALCHAESREPPGNSGHEPEGRQIGRNLQGGATIQ
jgi:hypothetical protein